MRAPSLFPGQGFIERMAEFVNRLRNLLNTAQNITATIQGALDAISKIRIGRQLAIHNYLRDGYRRIWRKGIINMKAGFEYNPNELRKVNSLWFEHLNEEQRLIQTDQAIKGLFSKVTGVFNLLLLNY